MQDWKHLTYLKTGIQHEKSGMEGQDRVCVRRDENCIVAALADGVSSRGCSALAAQAAAQTVCELLIREIPALETEEAQKAWILNAVTENVRKTAEENGAAVKNMDCTLVFVRISADGSVLIGQLGDSAVLVIRRGESIALNTGDEVANGTHGVMENDAQQHLQLVHMDVHQDGIDGILLTSDGLESELYLKGSSHVNQVAELYLNAVIGAESEQEAQAIVVERIGRLTEAKDTPFRDDIGLVVLTNATQRVQLPADPTWLCVCGARNYLEETYCEQCGRDFVELYRNVRFREEGGKAAFFKRMNADPQQERCVLGLSDAVEESLQDPIPVPKDAQDALLRNRFIHQRKVRIKRRSAQRQTPADLSAPIEACKEEETERSADSSTEMEGESMPVPLEQQAQEAHLPQPIRVAREEPLPSCVRKHARARSKKAALWVFWVMFCLIFLWLGAIGALALLFFL